jgi:hypothetical protein
MLITMARKPLGGTVLQTVLAAGSGALSINSCRVGTGTGAVTTVSVNDMRGGNYGQDKAAYADRPKLVVQRIDQGRWPANVMMSHGASRVMDGQSGMQKSPSTYVRSTTNSNQIAYAKGIGEQAGDESLNYGDTGGASRYFKKIGTTETP